MTYDERAPITANGAAVTRGSAALSGQPGLTATGAAVTRGRAALTGQVGLTATGAAITGGTATFSVTNIKEVAVWVVNHRLLLVATAFLAVGSPVISWALSLTALPGTWNIVIGISLNVVAAVAGAYALSRVLRKRVVRE